MNGNAVRIREGVSATLYCGALPAEVCKGTFSPQPTKVSTPSLSVILTGSQQEEGTVSNSPLAKFCLISLTAAHSHPPAFFH